MIDPSDELDHGMHDGLRVDHHIDLPGADAKQPARLDDFEPLVHQRCRIDRDLPAHAPRRMLQRLGRRHAGQFRSGPAAERPARRGQDDPLQLRRPPAVQALVNRVVLAVDRQNRHTAARGRFGDDAAGHHEHLFVGKRDGLAVLDGGQHRFQTVGAGRGAQHEVDVWMGRHGDQSLPTCAERHRL